MSAAPKMMTPAEMQADAAERIAELDEGQAAKFRLAAEFMIKTAVDVLEAPPADRAARYERARVEGAELGLDVSLLPEQFGPEMEAYLLGMWKVAGHIEVVTRGGVTSH